MPLAFGLCSTLSAVNADQQRPIRSVTWSLFWLRGVCFFCTSGLALSLRSCAVRCDRSRSCLEPPRLCLCHQPAPSGRVRFTVPRTFGVLVPETCLREERPVRLPLSLKLGRAPKCRDHCGQLESNYCEGKMPSPTLAFARMAVLFSLRGSLVPWVWGSLA